VKLFSRRRLIIFFSLAFFMVVAIYFWRDLGLGLDEIDIPDIIVENIEIDRVIDGDTWRLKARRAEHRQGVIYGSSVDVTVNSENGDVKRLTSESGIFTREDGDVTLNIVSGDIVLSEDGNISLSAGRAHYEAVSETWFFSEGVTLFDGTFEASGPEGLFRVKDGVSEITGGATVIWKEL